MKKSSNTPSVKVKYVVIIFGGRFASQARPRHLCESIGGARCVFDLEHFYISANCYIILNIYRGYPHGFQSNLTTARLLICKRYYSSISSIEISCTQSPGLLNQSTLVPWSKRDPNLQEQPRYTPETGGGAESVETQRRSKTAGAADGHARRCRSCRCAAARCCGAQCAAGNCAGGRGGEYAAAAGFVGVG